MRSVLLSLLFASVAFADPCGNCLGERVVGPGPVRFACPLCDGSGVVVIPVPAPPPMVAAAPGHRAAVCRVRCEDGTNFYGGSGVLIRKADGRGTVLTNWHVIRDGRKNVRVIWPDGTESPATVVADDRHWDLASLDVEAPAAEPVPLAAVHPSVGERLKIAGYGSHPYTYREAEGSVRQFWRPVRNAPLHIVEVGTTPRQGDSGGPILNDRGEVCAILHGGKDGFTMGSDVRAIRSFLGSDFAAECPDGRCAKR
jgi:hypothetical protein